MKKLILAAVMACGAGAAIADPVEGVWRTQPDDGAFVTVQISACEDKFCGTVLQAYNMQGQAIESPSIGQMMIWDMEAQGGGQYGDGSIRHPATGDVYSSKMELNGSQLKVSGCVAFICKSQIWQR